MIGYTAINKGKTEKTRNIYLFENNIKDTVGSHDLSSTYGQVSYATNDRLLGGFSFGPGVGNIIYNSTFGQGITSGWTMEGFVKFKGTSNQLFCCLGNHYTSSYAIMCYNGQAQFVINDVMRANGGNIIVGIWYYFAIVSTASDNLDFYWSPASSVSQTKINSYNAVGIGNWPNNALFALGYIPWAPATWPFAGYADNFRFSTVARTSFPTMG